MTYQDIVYLLGDKAKYLLAHQCKLLPKELILFPKGDHVRTVFADSDRNEKVIYSLEKLYGHGRLAHTGYLSILPVDQDIEHNASYSFYQNPLYFDPENIVKLAIEAQCSGLASTLGALGLVSKKYADKIPFIVKINHNELLTYPNKWDQIMFAQVRQAYEMGAIATEQYLLWFC
jgi:class I fructose-bisphosphate aldolase